MLLPIEREGKNHKIITEICVSISSLGGGGGAITCIVTLHGPLCRLRS